MKKLTLLVILLFQGFAIFSQCPTSNIVLTSQSEIDAFSITYPNCTQLTHELQINGENNTISNLNGLSAITEANKIFIINTEIQDFTGLHNITVITDLSIWFNPNIQNLEGLTSVQNIGGLDIWINNGILNLSGMDNIQSINSLNLFENEMLEDISVLSFIDALEQLVIGGNALNSLSGLENLQTVQGDLSISNESLPNFDELSNLKNIGGSLYLLNNSVQNLSAFSNIQELDELYVVLCPNLTDLNGLENIQTVSGRLRIGFNTGLNDLTVFGSLNSVGDLDIYHNENLQLLKGIENLQQVSGRVLITDNAILTDITAIGTLSPQVSELIIANNPSLSVCKNTFVCAVIEDPFVSKFINDNNTGCNSIEEVELQCLLGKGDELINHQIVVYPNPVSDILNIAEPENIDFQKLRVLSMHGSLLLEHKSTSIDLSKLATGIYFLEVITEQGKFIKKIVKD